MYLAAVIDWHSRYVLAWELSNSMDCWFCVSALDCGTPEIFNTDQGSQFISNDFTNVLLAKDVAINMGGRGRALDNVFIEKLWWTLKYEEIYPKAHADGSELYTNLDRYFLGITMRSVDIRRWTRRRQPKYSLLVRCYINTACSYRSASPSALWAALSGTGYAPRQLHKRTEQRECGFHLKFGTPWSKNRVRRSSTTSHLCLSKHLHLYNGLLGHGKINVHL
ncbi:DDE-type integrase/transposase/recombinase [Pseudodesulfovibrio nedwellii]|uniref:DDE-type integrase/transposase/recombinase n=1 Tax=Pseudodesulfovibrio nedwellii TaxID=2973072 RepID=UPI00336A1B7B